MKLIKDIIKNPTLKLYLENDDFITDYSDDWEDEGLCGYGMIRKKSSTQSDIDIEVRYDEDKDAFLTLVIFNIHKIYDDNKDFFNECLKDMGFVRAKQKKWVEFKQYVVDKSYWKNIILDTIDIESQIQKVAMAISRELFIRMDKAGIKPDKNERRNKMENKKNMNIIEAAKELKAGKKIMRSYWDGEYFLYLENDHVYIGSKEDPDFKEIQDLRPFELLAEDWEVYEEQPKQPLLTDEEKAYLEVVLRPFKDRVEVIYKTSAHMKERLCFDCDFADSGRLPFFDRNTMYKGMELDKNYTIEELGLFQD